MHIFTAVEIYACMAWLIIQSRRLQIRHTDTAQINTAWE